MILDNVFQESAVLDDLIDGVADRDAMVDMPERERVEFEEVAQRLERSVDATDAAMTAEGRDDVRVIIDDPKKRDDELLRVLTEMIVPLTTQFAGQLLDQQIVDSRSTRGRIKEILGRKGTKEPVRRLFATFRFTE